MKRTWILLLLALVAAPPALQSAGAAPKDRGAKQTRVERRQERKESRSEAREERKSDDRQVRRSEPSSRVDPSRERPTREGDGGREARPSEARRESRSEVQRETRQSRDGGRRSVANRAPQERPARSRTVIRERSRDEGSRTVISRPPRTGDRDRSVTRDRREGREESRVIIRQREGDSRRDSHDNNWGDHREYRNHDRRHDHRDWDRWRDHRFIRSLPRHHWTLDVFGHTFYYLDGLFYDYGPSGYYLVRAPIGAHISVLPGGYRMFDYNGMSFYLYLGTYFRFDPLLNVYVVVEPPVEDYSLLDVLYLRDGEVMEGHLLKSDSEEVDFLMDGEIYEIPIDEVESIELAP